MQVAVLAVLAVTIVAVGIGFEPVYEFAEIAADAAVDTEGYVDAVAPQEASDLIDSSANGGDH